MVHRVFSAESMRGCLCRGANNIAVLAESVTRAVAKGPGNARIGYTPIRGTEIIGIIMKVFAYFALIMMQMFDAMMPVDVSGGLSRR